MRDPRSSSVLSGLTIVLFMVATTAGLHAQSHALHGPHLPVAVDGNKTPERIPDSLAYEHVMKTLALPDNPSPEDLAGRNAYLARIGLGKEDQQVFISTLTGVKTSLDNLAVRRARVSSKSPAAIDALAQVRREERQFLSDISDHLRNQLSIEGRRLLGLFIAEHVKRRIVVYGGQPR